MINTFYKNYLWIIALLTGLQPNVYANQTVNSNIEINAELSEMPTDQQVIDALLKLKDIINTSNELDKQIMFKISLHNLKTNDFTLQDVVNAFVYGINIYDINVIDSISDVQIQKLKEFYILLKRNPTFAKENAFHLKSDAEKIKRVKNLKEMIERVKAKKPDKASLEDGRKEIMGLALAYFIPFGILGLLTILEIISSQLTK